MRCCSARRLLSQQQVSNVHAPAKCDSVGARVYDGELDSGAKVEVK